MNVQNVAVIKVGAAVATVLGIIFGFLEKFFAPSHILQEGPASAPGWVGWPAWLLTPAGAIVYIVIDFRSRKGD